MENIIKEKRKLLNMSQEQLAVVCNVSRQTINAIENNKYDPSLELAFLLSITLQTRLEELFIYKGK
ncbi:helix-turn-helix transcriptional regulator [Neobacillus sp. YIM B06451]|uniref:helix-turn-helix transcriptional regulator n=1 Tax=Neobacillus sp. YIM B06451 TaxID=3070994 RepID=UPI0029315D18|nr:helix-turn-helix transcriptional regulator [Neobacillus sp. YIM B06451]